MNTENSQEHPENTWRIIPFSKLLITMVILSPPKDRVGSDPFQMAFHFMAYKRIFHREFSHSMVLPKGDQRDEVGTISVELKQGGRGLFEPIVINGVKWGPYKWP